MAYAIENRFMHIIGWFCEAILLICGLKCTINVHLCHVYKGQSDINIQCI